MDNEEMGNILKIQQLSNDLYEILKDYEVFKISQDSIFEWIMQFDKIGMSKKEMVIILEELIRIFKITYFSKEKIIKYLHLTIKKMKGKSFSFLDIQKLRESDKYKSSSQSDYISLLKDKFPGVKVNNFEADILIYFDDYILSGNSIQSDLSYLKEKRLLNKTLFYLFIVTTNGEYQIKKIFKSLKGKCFFKLENRKTYKNKSDILWPYNYEIDICKEEDYSNMIFRESFSQGQIFNNDGKRKLLENWFWKAGCYIKSQQETKLLPLGSGYPKTVGSGIITATYRNIPNNTPICLWWDMDFWKPLLKRKTNKEQKEREINNIG